jgi:alanyl-tRNA synthetase
MQTKAIRKLFLEYFNSKNHTVVASSSLVPKDDPSLLFTSAGMVQFKKVFLGQEVAPYKRATSCQKCLRAGGKHNDLENVGFTSRHHTFFEMLGNFSFGDYFKKEAIYYAWEFINKYLKIPAEKLWVTVYKDDEEAAKIWLNDIGVSNQQLSKCDENDNFWAMGDTGPCGPCTEIYYDRGPDFNGNPPGFGDPGERYIEIYNLVFMQYNRTTNGELHNLPKPCVDTGMGLERVASIMQNVNSNYEIDIFAELIKNIAKLFNIANLNNPSLRVIADHLRACTFLVIDGVVPTNEGRGYVLRRIMRRAIRHGYKLGNNQPFFYLLVKNIVNIMGQDFQELIENQSKIEKIFLTEEQQFAKTLEHGMYLLQQEIDKLILNKDLNNIIDGQIVFKLYDTYGFPVDLISDVAREHELQLDLAGFEACMLEQKTRARKLNKFHDLNLDLENVLETKFIGYEQDTATVKILQIFDYNTNVALDTLEFGVMAKIVLDITPFYAESGGQVGDSGVLIGNNNTKFIVSDTQKLANSHIIHIGKLEIGVLKPGDLVTATVDINRREKIRLNHSATHLLQAALRTILGEHVKQKGSLVNEHRLRFDFEHSKPLTAIELDNIHLLVNKKIRENMPTVTEISSMNEAINKGAIALFDEKYQDMVRVLNIGNGFSVELCGGTHVKSTGDIGCFAVITEESIASGIRRIEAITGEAVVNYINNTQKLEQDACKLLNIADPNLINKQIDQLLLKNKELEKQLDILERKNIDVQIEALKSKVTVNNNGINVLVTNTNINPKYLKLAIDKLKQDLTNAIIILGCEYNARAMIVVGVTKNLSSKISAVDLIKSIIQLVDGKGGGRADLAEGSGNNIKALKEALNLGFNKIMESNLCL